MEIYKKSKYTIDTVRDGKHYLWNTLSGALATVDQDVTNTLSTKSVVESECPHFSTLKENHFIVPSEFDEYKYVLERAKKIKENKLPSNMNFVIAPTLKCNYHCQYCFEDKRTSFCSMTEETCSDVKQFISEKIDANINLKCIHITWFGGEPLLCLNTIEDVSSFINSVCAKRNIACRFSLVTNGRYLDSHAIEVLQKINVKRIQVSFDGPQEVYCQSKKASVDDYKQTLNNIELAAQCGLPIIIRINTRNNDFTPAYALADLLLRDRNLARKIKLYPAYVVEGDVVTRSKQYTAFVEHEKEFARYIYDNYSANSYYNKLAASHGVSCSLSCRSNCCIGPSGELYKCEHHFGQIKYVVGNVRGNTTPFAYQYESICYSNDQKSKCKDCPVFPICMGGCPNAHLMNEKNFDCKSFIEHLIDRQLRIHIQ